MGVVSCGDPAAGPGKSAVFLVTSPMEGKVWTLFADVYNPAFAGRAGDSAFWITIESIRKDPSGHTVLNVYSDIIFTEYLVKYYRNDGNPNVPSPFAVNLNERLSAGGKLHLETIVITRDAKLRTPLKELAFGGGEGTIRLNAVVTFYGKDLAGNAVIAEHTVYLIAGDFPGTETNEGS